MAGAKYVISKRVTLGADYDAVFYNLSQPDGGLVNGRYKPIEQYITINAGLNLAANTVLKVATRSSRTPA